MTPYDEGFRSRLAGKSTHANPYAPMTTEHHDWQSGWIDQDHHLTGRDEALDSIGWFGTAS